MSLGWVLSAGLVGCQAPAPADGPTRHRVAAADDADLDLLWDAVGRTLERYAFRLDRQDRLAGVVTTHPETSAHWFEFWRPQPEPAYYWMESNLHTIQRKAQVQLTRVADLDAYEVDVTVQRYKYNLEERQIDDPAAALRMFGSAAPTVSGRQRTAAESAYWTELGRDEPMERALLASILTRYDGGVGEWPNAPDSSPAP